MKEFGMLQPKALALVFVLGFLVDPTLPQQVEVTHLQHLARFTIVHMGKINVPTAHHLLKSG